MRLTSTVLWLSFAACAAEVDLPTDADMDGLLSHLESEAGTDPANPDSDGDNHLDGAEYFGGTNPLDGEDYPYHGGWRIDGDCRNDVQGASGFQKDGIAGQFKLIDQFGDGVRLHDFCGKVVLLKRSAGWCGACRGAEPELVALYEEYKDEDFISITLVLEGDTNGQAADQAFVEGWAEQYGAKHPVVIDDQGYGGQFERDGGIPSYALLSRGAKIVTVDEGKPTHEQIDALLAE